MTTAPTPPARPPGALWALPDAAGFLMVSVKTLSRAVSGGRVQAIRIGRRVLIPDGEVKRLAREGC